MISLHLSEIYYQYWFSVSTLEYQNFVRISVSFRLTTSVRCRGGAREHCSQEMLNSCRKFVWMKICYWKFEGNLNTHVSLWAQQHMVDRHYSLNLKPWSAKTLYVYAHTDPAQKYSVGLQEIFVSRLCSQDENYFFLPCPMLCQLSYAVWSVRVCDISEQNLVPSISMSFIAVFPSIGYGLSTSCFTATITSYRCHLVHHLISKQSRDHHQMERPQNHTSRSRTNIPRVCLRQNTNL
jgi:hypothetical protein